MSERDRLDEQGLHAPSMGSWIALVVNRSRRCSRQYPSGGEAGSLPQSETQLARVFDPVLEQPVPQRLRATFFAPGAGGQSVVRPWSRGSSSDPSQVRSAMPGWLATPNAYAPSAARSGYSPHRVYTGGPAPSGGDRSPGEQLVTSALEASRESSAGTRLARFGYNLVGGRLLPGERGPAAQFMYEDAPATASRYMSQHATATVVRLRFTSPEKMTCRCSIGSTAGSGTPCRERSIDRPCWQLRKPPTSS